jgi:hypothetical protein
VQEWRDNRSEGASFYFFDPDGYKLEAQSVTWPRGWKPAASAHMPECSSSTIR